ncbi:MAG TPA: S-adenosylmethionine:tRNA ribosyltransferase-isomerase [Candidatus Limnocylindria bacterium]|nr:S-adenosylmethionine:tRNA ribosyltransferase-isomerase [Candidatus Limnocylindria bacterium]
MTATTFTLPARNEATTTPEGRGLDRDAVRLLVTDRASGTHRDARFFDLPAFLAPGDLVVVNDSATIPAALRAERSDGAPLALHLSTRLADELWVAEPRAQVVAGERVSLVPGGSATFLAPLDPAHPRLWYVLLALPLPFDTFLAVHGAPIRYRYVTSAHPLRDYQTIFARVPGSAEMPSAARPFSHDVLDELYRRGIGITAVTLHTGVASPERDERPYREPFVVSPVAAAAVNAARWRGGRIVAIGTTVVRALESAALDGEAVAASGWTDLVITPERGVALVDALLTGFHEPQASHLDLLRAFLDERTLSEAYDHALAHDYLWHEFGDVHLIL